MNFYTEIDRRKRAARVYGICPVCDGNRRLVAVFGLVGMVCQVCASKNNGKGK